MTFLILRIFLLFLKMKKAWADIFFIIAGLVVFLLESGGFGAGVALSFVLATVMLGSDRWGALVAFLDGFLLDLITRVHFFGLSAVLFLMFNLIFQIIDRYSTVTFWHKISFSMLCILIYRVYLFFPVLPFDLNRVFFVRGIAINFFLVWVFYLVLSNLYNFLEKDSDLQLSLKL